MAVLAAAVLMAIVPGMPAEARKRQADKSCGPDGCEAVAKSEDEARRGRSTGTRRRATTRWCRYVPLDLPPDASVVRPDGSTVTGDGQGRWIERICQDTAQQAEIGAHYQDGDPVSKQLELQNRIAFTERRAFFVTQKDAPALIEEARSRLTFPTLQPRYAPAEPWTYVNHPTGLWLDGEGLQPQTTTAEIPGVRVSVRAEPREVHWSTGDGQVEICPVNPRRPDPSKPGDGGECTHRWTWPSAGEAGTSDGAYEVTATVMWHITWTAEGAPGGGDLGVIPQRSEVMRVLVAEIQILNTPTPR